MIYRYFQNLIVDCGIMKWNKDSYWKVRSHIDLWLLNISCTEKRRSIQHRSQDRRKFMRRFHHISPLFFQTNNFFSYLVIRIICFFSISKTQGLQLGSDFRFSIVFAINGQFQLCSSIETVIIIVHTFKCSWSLVLLKPEGHVFTSIL